MYSFSQKVFLQLYLQGALGDQKTVDSPLAASSLQTRAKELSLDRQNLPKRSLRIAHITDTHIEPSRIAEKGLAKVLNTIESMTDKPDVIFNTGDSILDALAMPKEIVKRSWAAWHKILNAENQLPIYNTLGNHDIFGWMNPATGRLGKSPLYGKDWALDELKMPNRYYSFDLAGWRFIVLDSMVQHKLHYQAKLDDEQFAWLENILAHTPSAMPVAVLSHIPIVSVTGYFMEKGPTKKQWKIPGAWMHLDAQRIKDLFYRHPNVRICLSGHMHMIDQVEYMGVKYLCNGAVCGAWWKGNYFEFPPAFAIIDLYEDGSSYCEPVFY